MPLTTEYHQNYHSTPACVLSLSRQVDKERADQTLQTSPSDPRLQKKGGGRFTVAGM